MRDPSYVDGCSVCAIDAGETAVNHGEVYRDDLWMIWHAGPPYGVAGWMTVLTHQHVAGIAHFDDAHAARLGPDLRHFEKVLEEVTGALRIYTATMNESSPHFHLHMVPRYAVMAQDAKAWAVFNLQAAATRGEVRVDAAAVERIVVAYREALRVKPPRQVS
jgi:diadenosine tetraphosphate (Ap4A) HIT family hydrolase